MAGGFAVEDVHALSLQAVFEESFFLSRAESSQQSVAISNEEFDVSDDIHAASAHRITSISVSDISLAFIKELRKLAPFGVGNPEPVVQVCGVVVSVSQFGKEKNHFELVLADSKKPKVQARCMAFFSSPSSFSYEPSVGDEVCVTGTLSESRFAGRVRAELRSVHASSLLTSSPRDPSLRLQVHLPLCCTRVAHA
jgi:predicted extracellular nuclease